MMASNIVAALSAPSMRQRPIYGGVFGDGRYSLATMPFVSRGLHAVRFMVIEPRAGSVLSIAEDKQEALASARRLLLVGEQFTEPAANDDQWEQARLWSDEPPVVEPECKPVSRRRRDIFEKSEGRCHYCGTTLSLDGRWHIEHMVPKALDGTDAFSNLVAACVPCNLSKRDRTALEFIVQMAETDA
jgi:hypothetical protein